MESRVSHKANKENGSLLFVLTLGANAILASGSFADSGFNPAMSDITVVFGAADVAVENSTCVVLSNSGDTQRRNYNLTITEDGIAGFFATNLTYPSYSLPLYLTWRDEVSGTTAWTVDDGIEEVQQRVGNLSTSCPGGELSYLEVVYLLSDYELSYAPAGVYSTTLTLEFNEAVGGNGTGNKVFSGIPPVEVTNPGGGIASFSDTVTIDLDIEELTKVTRLDDLTINTSDWAGWVAGQSLEVVDSFCIYTNDTSEQVFITASTSQFHTTGSAGETTGSSTFGLLGSVTGETLFYEVAFSDDDGSSWNDSPANGSMIVSAFDTRSANVDCTSGASTPDNMQLRLRLPASQAQTSAEDTYTGVLQILVTYP